MDNNVFNPNRFYKLIVRNIKSIRKYWLQSLLIFAGIPLLIFLINLSNIGLEIGLSERTSFLEGLVSTLVIISPFMLFFNYTHPKKGLTEVMLAASVFEKYLVMQLACLVVTPLAILTLYGGADSFLAFLFPQVQGGHVIQQLINGSVDWNRITIIVLFQQGILFFNLLFVNRKVVKTGGVFILIMIGLIASLVITVSILESSNTMIDYNRFDFDFSEKGLFTIYSNAHPIIYVIQFLGIFMQIIVPLAFMIGSYFVLKNKRY